MRSIAVAIVGTVLVVAATVGGDRRPTASAISSPAPDPPTTPGTAAPPCAEGMIEATVEIALRLGKADGSTVAGAELAQTRDVLARRTAALGPDGCRVWSDGTDEILVQLAGSIDPATAAAKLTTIGLLEIVDPQGQFLPLGTTVVTTRGGPTGAATPVTTPVFETVVGGADLVGAFLTRNQTSQYVVAVALTAQASERFCAFTTDHIGQPLAVVLDKEVISSPVVNSPICGGLGIVEGLSMAEAAALCTLLNTGALPVPVEVVSVREIAPGDGAATESPISTGAESPPPSPTATQPADAQPTTAAVPTAQAYAGDPLASGCWTPEQVVSAASERPQWSAPPTLVIDPAQTYLARVETNKGTFVIELLPEAAPTTVNNFVCLARSGYYDGTPIHRIVADFVVQAGDPTGTGSGGPGYTFADEPMTGVAYERGTVAMANAGPDTNGSQFFVCLVDLSQRLPLDYTIFGQVTEGMETVDRIAATPTLPTEFGEQSKPAEPVVIERVLIIEEPNGGTPTA